jgi:hypothetical protein
MITDKEIVAIDLLEWEAKSLLSEWSSLEEFSIGIKNLNFSLINCFPISKADASEEELLIRSDFCEESYRTSHIIFRIIHRILKADTEIWCVFEARRKLSFTVNSLSVFKVFHWDLVLFYFSFTVEKVKLSEGIPSVILVFSFFLFARREKLVSLFV